MDISHHPAQVIEIDCESPAQTGMDIFTKVNAPILGNLLDQMPTDESIKLLAGFYGAFHGFACAVYGEEKAKDFFQTMTAHLATVELERPPGAMVQ